MGANKFFRKNEILKDDFNEVLVKKNKIDF